MSKKVMKGLKTWKDWVERTNAKQLRIALIMTGGTIISVPNQYGALEPAKDPRQLLKFVQHLADYGELEIIPVLNKDSTEITPKDWGLISQAIADKHDQFDAFVVMHGTDTIAWSATAIRFCLGQTLRVPVIFVGSQLSLVAPRTDAINNLEDALETVVKARRMGLNEVMIVAGRNVFRGVRSVKVSEANFNFIDSPGTLPLAFSDSSGVIFGNNLYQVKVPSNLEEKLPEIKLDIKFDESVIVVDLSPNITADLLEKILVKTKVCSGIIFGSFGAGNTPKRILTVIKQLTKMGVHVLVAPQRDGIETSIVYENARLARLAGAIQTKNMTIVAATVKLMQLLTKPELKSVKEKLQKELLTNYYGEVTEKD